MRKFISLMALACVLMTSVLSADDDTHTCNRSSKKTSDNFFPAFRLVLTPQLVCQNFGFAALGEIGSKNYRGSATLGLFYCDRHRIKISSEFLGQKLHYKFFSGNTHRWEHQWAVGGTYQCLHDGYFSWDECRIIDGFQVHGFYSNTHDHDLHPERCPVENIRVRRHIAPGTSYVIEAGPILRPWECSELIINLGYDHTRYKREFHHHDKELSGLSGSIELTQYLACNMLFNFRAEFRRPYNYIEALLGWNRSCRMGELYLGIFGSHTFGKCELPCSSAVGGEIRFTFGVENCCNLCKGCCEDSCCGLNPCLADWLARPAVYMPTVLAVADQRVIHLPSVCKNPTSIDIPGFCAPPYGQVTYDVSGAFDGNGKKISFSQTGIPSNVGDIDPKTGVITVTNNCNIELFYVTVKGTTKCGSTTEQFWLELPCKKNGDK